MNPTRRLGGLALAFFLGAAVFSGRAMAGPGAGIAPPEYPQIGIPDAAAAQSLLNDFRQAGFAAGDYYLEFNLRQVPRRGDEQDFSGRLWGGRRDGAMMLRIALRDSTGRERQLLLQNGPQSAAWSAAAGGAVALADAAILQPLVDGIELTAFDLQMPYLFWPDMRVVGINRIRGRPAYAFLFRPPATFAVLHPELGAVRAFLDTEFDRPLQVDLIGPAGGVLKTLSLVDLKKVNGQWMLKEFDELNQVTRDYTRFTLTGVALGLDLGPEVLAPGHLGEAAPAAPAGRVHALGP